MKRQAILVFVVSMVGLLLTVSTGAQNENTLLAIGEARNSTLTVSSPETLLTISAKAGVPLQVDLIAVDSNLFLQATIEQATVVLQTITNNGSQPGVSVMFNPPTDGFYILRISALNGGVGNFIVVVDEVQTPGAALVSRICLPLVNTAISTTTQVCSGMGRNQACVGTFASEALGPNLTPLAFTRAGEIVNLDQLASVQLNGLDEGTGIPGVILAQLQTNLTANNTSQSVTIPLYGEFELLNRVTTEPQLAAQATPLQFFDFIPAIPKSPCSDIPNSGVVVSSPDSTTLVELTINDITMQIIGKVGLYRGPENANGQTLAIQVLEGTVITVVLGETHAVLAGQRLIVPVDVRFRPIAQPSQPSTVMPTDIAMPSNIFPMSVPLVDANNNPPPVQNCTISLAPGEEMALRVGPGNTRTIYRYVSTPTTPLDVMGYNDDDNQRWYLLDKSQVLPATAAAAVNSIWVLDDSQKPGGGTIVVNDPQTCAAVEYVRASAVVRARVPVEPPTTDETTETTDSVPVAPPVIQPPAAPPAGSTEPFVDFRISSNAIPIGDCTTLSWNTANIREVYYQGQPVSGVSSQQECPDTDTTYRLRVVPQSGSDINRSLDVVVSQIVEAPDCQQSDLPVFLGEVPMVESGVVQYNFRVDPCSIRKDIFIEMFSISPTMDPSLDVLVDGNLVGSGRDSPSIIINVDLPPNARLITVFAQGFDPDGTFDIVIEYR